MEFKIYDEVQNGIQFIKNDKEGREQFYHHIRRAFKNKECDSALLALYLYAYLASWGMLRNSFLMQKDYKFLIKLIDILRKDEYKDILDYNPFNDDTDDKINLIDKLFKEINNFFENCVYLDKNAKEVKVKNVTDTLITKIMLGTLGCTIAYDTYAKLALKHYGLCQTAGKKSYKELRDFAKANKEEIVKATDQLVKVDNNLKGIYPPMKIIDMFLFSVGYKI